MPAIILQLLMFISVSVLTSCQDHNEKQYDKLTPINPRRSVKEKAIIVPPEVSHHWKALKLVVIDKTRGTENIYVVPIGSPFTINSSGLTITVEAFLPSFTIEGTIITTASNELVNPAAKVRIRENGKPVFRGWLFSNFPNTHAVTHPKYGFSLIGVVPVPK